MNLLKANKDDIKNTFKNGDITVSIFGLGKMGLPLAAVFADKGAHVIGVDINESVVEGINQRANHINGEPGLSKLVKKNVECGRLKATLDGIHAANKADICVILVPTLTDENGNIQLEPVKTVAKTISKGLKKGNIVVTEATMPPGTTESLIPIFEKGGLKLGEFGLGHAPERTMSGTAIRDIAGQYPKIVGANNREALDALCAIYGIINEKGTIDMPDIISAEAVKVFEGVYRDVNIALANELAMYCEEKHISALDIFNAANSQPFCDIHEPGAGVGGHCIPIYPWFVINQIKKGEGKLLRTARDVNDHMPYHIVDLVEKSLMETKNNFNDSNVLILGLTFRGGVKEFTKTPAKPVINELKKRGANVFAYDPICNKMDAERYGAKWKDDFQDIDAIVILTDHEEFTDIKYEDIKTQLNNKIIVDGRNVLDKNQLKKLGYTYLAVGDLDFSIKQ